MDHTKTTEKILSIDFGGSHIKTAILNEEGKLLTDFQSIKTPQPATLSASLEAIQTLVKNFKGFDKISVGFPGYIKNGIVLTAPNLDQETWSNVNFSEQLSKLLGKPAKVINDADMLALGVISGSGLEMMVTLGTGFGTAFALDGKLLPHLELAHHPITTKKSYDEYIGDNAYDDVGKKKWNIRLKKIISILKTVFNYDTLYIGGGNAKHINFELDANIKVVTNKDGIDGGAKLWQQN
ncbi:ROK family protein [Flavobacterium sp. TAB 87]|uniref:ROK family protein n=1 Tax=Flavobacterium sp. TAB 87 TaxID=1729581 RepID=UPI00076DBE4B|nr:ROK family protein [Flavobacterium sp. TAB 87]KVV16173.1 Polyphosphate glucokinase [Flavobacterium sp. TAB 87]